MESKGAARFTLGKQSSLAPDRGGEEEYENLEEREDGEGIDSGVRLMYLANEGDLEGIKELLDSGTDVNFRDIDDRTALHVSACQGSTAVVKLLLERGAEVDPKDRWGSTVFTFSASNLSIIFSPKMNLNICMCVRLFFIGIWGF